jgi:hypothetical protein
MTEFERLEHGRITAEVLKDRELQFSLFWQSITVTAVIFSFCAPVLKSAFWFDFPFVILAPHLIIRSFSVHYIFLRYRTSPGAVITQDIAQLRGDFSW